MKRLSALIITLVILLQPGVVFAYASSICSASDFCKESEVGPFMAHITSQCGNQGDCSLEDIMTVVVNVGNYIVGLIGAVVLLMYVVGGFFWLSSAGSKERVATGKKYMTTSTIGLLIVMFSYLGIYALKGTLQYGDVYLDDGSGYVACSGTDTIGQTCDLYSTCTVDGCESLCDQAASLFQSEDEIQTVLQYQTCVDRAQGGMSSSSTDNPWYNTSSCQTNLCPGPASIQCCQVEYRY